ncbi:hypothetical protein INT45_000573 [Circinella minor]|uniref:F-box domain-containing protein n=1 Tax=Circinella minor TaxID=1195481 RepID=A0A8H7SBF2_9FUNG|nr:hypothetical protein INT45_000573 [Circinella minor]
MSQQSLNDLAISINTSIKALNENEYNVVINETVAAVKQIDKVHVDVLSLRLTAYEKKGDLDKAYDIALSIISQFPTFNSGYVHAATILIKKRKPELAIDICNKGLEILSVVQSIPTTIIATPTPISPIGRIINPELQALYEIKKVAEQEQSCKIDFIKTLPYDIITLVLKYLEMNDIINCMKVSRSWHRSVLNCPSSFREWRILPGKEELKDYDETEYGFLKQLSDHIWCLDLFLQYEQPTQQKIINLLATVMFRHLRSFRLYCTDVNGESLQNLLRGAGSSLEELFISFGDPFAFLPNDNDRKMLLSEITEYCPNLKKLTYDTPGILEYYGGPMLTQLTELRIYGSEVEPEEVECILMDMPGIRELSIGHCKSIVLRVLYKLGDNLRYISLNPDRFQPDNMFSLINDGNNNNTVSSTRKYDRMLDVHYCMRITAALLLPLLHKHKQTEALTVNVTASEPNNVEKWRSFADFGSSYMRYMKFGFTSDTEEIFASAVRNCPNLQEFEMRECSPTHIMYSALCSLVGLKRFVITNDMEEPKTPVDDRNLRAFFEHHATLGDRSTLEEVSLHYTDSVEASTIQILSKIKSLKVIDLAGPFLEGEMSIDTALQTLTVSSLPLLDTIRLQAIPVIDEGIKKMDCRVIQLAYMDYITTSGVESLISNSRLLKILEVQDNEEIDIDEIQQITKHNDISLIIKTPSFFK